MRSTRRACGGRGQTLWASLAMLEGIPYNNVKKYVKAVNEWMDSFQKWKEEGKVSFDSTPSSATGQYDRLYNAIQSGDSEEAAAAMKKLEQMNKTDKVDSEPGKAAEAVRRRRAGGG